MVHYCLIGKCLLSAVIGATVWFGSATVARCDDPEPVAAFAERTLQPPPPKALPPRDCLRCCGPASAAPCFDTHRGFLYYGTNPWDDDPVGGFDGCPRAECGYFGAMLSLRWIEKHRGSGHGHSRRHRRRHHSGHCARCGPAPAPGAGIGYETGSYTRGAH